MPEQAAVAGRPAGQPQQRQEGSFINKILQMVAMYVAMQFVMKQFFPNQQAGQIVKDADGKIVEVPKTVDIPPYEARPDQLDEGAAWNPNPMRAAPIWPPNSKLDIVVTVSDSFIPSPIASTPKSKIVLDEKGFGLGNWTDKRTAETTIDVPATVQRNGTLWGHFYVGLAGSVLDPKQRGFDPGSAYHFTFPLTQYIAKKKVKKLRSLLAKQNETEAPEAEAAEEDNEPSVPVVGNYYHPNASLSFIPDTGVLMLPQTPISVRQFVNLEATGARDGSGQHTWYYPILFVNTFWQLKSHMTQLNETVKTLPVRIDLNNLANWKFTTLSSIELNSREAAKTAAWGGSLPGGGDGTEIEMVKEILLDTNPILLGITTAVTILHLIFETLAFTSDVAHYRKKKDNVGISVRTILANVFMQTIIFLYLVDNSQNTSWMILGSQGVGIIIELWKITTVVNVRVREAPPGSLLPYRVAFEDKHKLSDTEEKTKEYDEIAFKYMYMAGVPLLLAYAVYSVLYEEHKGWYSFIITTLVGSVYAYGFLMMVPALYINYRLKSVAHMPAKAMMYKFLNTFIDDLFAFTIKMPFLHRLSTFRDDVIFFIYLYQRWAYRIDYTRVNEFGQGGEDETEAVKKDEGKALPPVDADAAKSSDGGEGKASGTDAGAAKAVKRK